MRAMGAIPALVFDTIVWQIRVHQSGEIANSTIQEMLGVKSKKTISDAIKDLIADGWIVRTKGNGSGNKSVYMLTEKGIKNAPFIEEKGIKNDPKRDKKITQKGIENAPLLKDIKELKEREVTPTPIPNQNEKIIMKDFETWWSKYPGDPEYSYDKENCEKVWSLMQPEWREKLVTMAERGIRWRTKQNDKPIFYLRDYSGQDAQMELPFVRQGSKTFAKWIEDHEHKDVICLFRYEGSLAYCLEDAKQMMIDAGAEFIRSWI